MKFVSLTAIPVALALGAQAAPPAPPKTQASVKSAPTPCVTEQFTIYFPENASSLNDHGEAVLDAVADRTSHCRYYRIEVTGHADASGSVETNRALSEARARAVSHGLQDREVHAETVDLTAEGEARAIAENGYIEPLNRRADVRLLPLPGQTRDS